MNLDKANLPHLLIVEDDEINYLVLEKIFSDEYFVARCTSGIDCINYCNQHKPVVVLLDVGLPGLSGLDTCKLLKASNETADISVIFVTSHDNDDEQTQCWLAGGNDFVSKPVNALTIKHRVHAQFKYQQQKNELKKQAYVDGLTGVYNRRYLDCELSKKLSVAKRSASAFALLILDVDWFKLYNDHYGHLEGDRCLKKIATLIQQPLLRQSDSVSRYGGEEFVCILPQTDLVGAKLIAEQIQALIAQTNIQHQASPIGHVTTSIGITATHTVNETDPVVWINSADEALFLAKNNGRNCIKTAKLGEGHATN
ncbi:diguanylate cyclase [Catenovulum agarivorans]|uniref:GGDEF domain-containing response regulator n=1 Tax=Catenovulum agarivorans TaxID=1172192 RepID=UPI0002DD54AD|nr:diguanylate cyclase [Catenovulum agarivorans]